MASRVQLLVAFFLVLSVAVASVQGGPIPPWCWEPMPDCSKSSSTAAAPYAKEMIQVESKRLRGSQFWPSSTRTTQENIQGRSKESQEAPLMGN
ncbi:hypothetical protein M758_11G081100 [Ceratodon purpureus]|nr:hypothetical protein KC19_11G084300 [Ceratodon purpureus]KAG0556855.1 hypothetical protein KC19_11G084300 [Ceratodon purpureus]KAG0556856.1 hypothetical protein KC19_11G084300 [Ceratodon purpureus]KAG0601062.1 hypothetical protein M758_11G081100 [Ceratodon purpureus]